MSIEWQGWLIEMSVGRFVLATAITLAATLIVIGFLRVIRRAPGRIRESLRTSRRERGYRALTQGMVAVAAGDPDVVALMAGTNTFFFQSSTPAQALEELEDLILKAVANSYGMNF